MFGFDPILFVVPALTGAVSIVVTGGRRFAVLAAEDFWDGRRRARRRALRRKPR